MEIENLVSITEYANIHNVNRSSVRQKVRIGTLKAIKIGGIWLIDKNEPYIDKRFKSGKYVGWRRRK